MRTGLQREFFSIRQALLHLGQQQVDFNATLTSLINARFERINSSVGQLKNLLHGFLSDNVSKRIGEVRE